MKSLTTAMENALEGGALLVMFAELELDSGTQRFCTHSEDIVWDSHTWYALGLPLEIGPIRESDSLESIGVVFTLNQLTPTQIQIVLGENTLGRPATCWLGALTSAGALIADPSLSFSGRCDPPVLGLDKGQASIRFSVENRMARWSRPLSRRFTDADQQSAYSGDKFFEFVPQMTEKVIVFPNREYFR